MADSLTSFTGVSSGLDWRALVDQIMTLERRTAVKLEGTITANGRKKDAINAFQAQLQSLKDVADRLRGVTTDGSGSPFTRSVVTVTRSSVDAAVPVAATVGTSGAPSGTYALDVTSVARAQKVTGAAGVAPTWTLGGSAPGTLTLTRPNAGTPFASIAVAPTDGLAQVRDKINALNRGTTPSGVQASIVQVSATEQRLVLTGTQTGEANGFTVGDDGASGLATTLGLTDAALAASPTLVQAARDAVLTIDGVEVRRASNSITDVLDGVSLTVSAEGAATLAVARQTSAVTDVARQFVEGYNAAVRNATGQSRDTRGPLFGDPLLRTVRSSLSSIVVGAATPASQGGPAGVADDLTTLAALGFSLQKDGTLTLDVAKFNGAVEGRSAEVEALLADRMDQVSDWADTAVKPFSGIIEQRESNLDTQNARLQARIDAIDSRLDKRRAALLAQYAKFEATLGRLKAIEGQMAAQFTGQNNSGKD